MVIVEVVSGNFRGKPEKLKEEILDAFSDAISLGVGEALQEFIKTVAKRSGRLRRSLATMINMQVLDIEDRRVVQVDFNKLNVPSYAKYHVYGDTGEARSTSPYKHSQDYLKYQKTSKTVLGTKPISQRKLMALIKRKIKEQLIIQVRGRKGLSMSVYDVLTTQ